MELFTLDTKVENNSTSVCENVIQFLYNEPITEARAADDVKDFMFKKDHVMLPFNQSDKLKGALLFTLNTSIDGIVSLLTNKNPFLMNKSKIYNTYYYDYTKIRGCIVCDRVSSTPMITNADAKAERIATYDEIRSKIEGIATPVNIDRALGKNIVYDLQPVVNYMRKVKKLTSLNISIRLKAFFDTINSFYVAKYGDYQNKAILVDLDEFSDESTLDDCHVLLYILTLFTRSTKAIEEFKYPMKFILYSSKGFMTFSMKDDLSKQNIAKFRGFVKRLHPKLITDIENKAIRAEIINNFNMKMGLTGNAAIPEDSELGGTLQNAIRDDLDSEGETDIPEDEVEIVDEIDEEIEKDEDLKRQVMDALTDNKTSKVVSKASLARDKMLREKQKNIIVKTKTIGELKKQVDIAPIKEDRYEVSEVLNESITKVRFDNFQEEYNVTTFEKDIANAITAFNDKSIDVNVVSVDVEDTSDVLCLKDTYTIHLEDENRNRHTIKVNIPKFIDNQFLWIGGNKKIIKKQLIGLPVIKTGPATVQVCSSSYNKVFITREGSRFNPNMEKFKKILLDKQYGVTFTRGNNISSNKGKLTCLEYDQFAEKYNEIIIGDCHYVFSVDKLEEKCHTGADKKAKSEQGKYLIGYKGDKNPIPIYYDQNNEDHVDMVSTMILNGKPELYDEFKTKSFGKRYMSNTATIMKKNIPLVVLLCYFEGLSTVIKKFDDENVKIVDKKSNKDNYIYIPFQNAYLQYPMTDTEACIFFNGLSKINTAQYDLSEMDQMETYIDILDSLCGSASGIMPGLLNAYEFFIDSITLEIIRLYNLPEDFVSLFIYASNLLADNQYNTDIGFTNYRLRDNEIVAAILYKELTKTYSTYRKTKNSKTQTKLSLNPDCVINEINAITTVTDYSKLSPILEYRETHLASMSGYAGMNLDDAYTLEKRSYDDSMTGVIGVSSDTAGNIGRERHLVIEPNVKNVRGIIDVTDPEDKNKLDYTKYSTGIESMIPGGLRHDDERRTAMAVKQKGHLLPIKDSSPLLITNGFDSMIHYRTSDDFSVVAKEDGKVLEIDTKSNIMVVEYKSGKRKAIDLSQKQAKNGGGGMYLRNQLVTSFKTGDTFKRGAILAYDKYFYKDTGPFGNRALIGTLVKSVSLGHSATHEDSTLFTQDVSTRMSADISMPDEVIVGKNATVEFIVKPGDTVKVGDPLIKYETSYDNDELNQLLGSIRADLQEEIINLGKSSITSHYAGVVDDVTAYSAVPIDELSPSLQKIVKDTFKDTKAKQKTLDKYDTNKEGNKVYRLGVLIDKPTDKVEPDRYGKIAGRDVGDGVLIKFHVNYHDEISDGDKLVHMTANKGTCGFKIPKYYEPRTEFRPYEEISIFVAPSAVMQRTTPTVITDMCVYKVLIETKRKMYEILTGESWNEKAKRENPDMVITPDMVGETFNADEFALASSLMAEQVVEENCLLTDDKVLSETACMEGDILYTGYVATRLYQYLKENDGKVSYKEPNVRYDSVNETIVALDTLYPNEVLRLSFY